ncbi:MAG TPA: MXAN_6577-like cysteine-rich protein [Myxococcaceae bacterium]|jgi:hypothetical protein
MNMQAWTEHLAPRRRWVMAMAVAALGWLMAGCPAEGVDCGEALTQCGDACVDTSSSDSHCGACGTRCALAQVCVEGSCQCQAGATLCGSQCVLTQSDPANCGGCAGQGGRVCATGEVCESGQCKVACDLATSSRCGDACVNLQTDANHCGTCGQACGNAQSCKAGVCSYDVVAACFNTGQVVGIQAGSDIKGPNVPLGDRPQSLARMQDVLLVLDAATKLRQARLTDYGRLNEEVSTGSAPNQVLARDPFVYVINSTSNTLLTFERRNAAKPQPVNGTRFPDGLGLSPVASLDFGANTNPFAMALLGNELWVTLYGNLLGDTTRGGKVARVSLADPGKPTILEPSVELPTGAALQPFPGSNPIPAPAGLVVHRGSIYVTLNNLDPSTFNPGGPGLLAKINPTTRQVSTVALGEGCLNAGWAASVGNKLLVSCAGKATYDSNFNLVSVEKTGLVLLDEQDVVVATYTLACPEGSGSTCPLPSAGRFSVAGNRAYLGDNNAGRLFVIEVSGNQLLERRGLGAGAQPAILACPAQGFSLVGDVVAIP